MGARGMDIVRLIPKNTFKSKSYITKIIPFPTVTFHNPLLIPLTSP